MKPLYLKLRGFKGIRAGLGLDEIELDLRNLPTGLISICGENGRGKTTLMDNLHPYRLMPYKLKDSDGWSTRAFSYYRQTFGRDALKELIWQMGEITYRSVIMIDAEKGAQEAYLYQEDSAGTWHPYNTAVKDGKTAPYDQAVEEICGTPSMFFTSVFRGQKAKELTAYSRGDILAVVTELLNIDHIKLQGQKAGEVVKALTGTLDSITTLKKPLLAAQDGRQTLLDSQATQQAGLEQAKQESTDLAATLASAEKRLQSIELACSAETVSRQRLAEMEARHGELGREKNTAIAEADRTLAGYRQDQQAATNDLAQAEREAEKELSDALAGFKQDQQTATNDLAQAEREVDRELADIGDRRQVALDIISRAEEIRQAVEREAEVDGQLTKARTTRETLVASYKALAERQKEGIQKKSEVDAAQREVKAEEERRTANKGELIRERERCEVQKRTLDVGLDCKADGSGWTNDACPLLQDALKAKARIDEIDAQVLRIGNEAFAVGTRLSLVDLRGVVERLSTEHQNLYGTVDADIKACTEEGAAAAQRITDLEGEAKRVAEVAALIFDLETAEERIQELAGRETSVKSLLEEKRKANTTRQHELANKITGRETATKSLVEGKRTASATRQQDLTTKISEVDERLKLKIVGIDRRQAELATEISTLKNTLSGEKDTEQEECRTAIATARQNIEAVDRKISDRHRELGALAAQLTDLDTKAVEITRFDERTTKINEELIAWKVLVRACSNDGIISLEVDDAGPSISAIANDLLSSCYGPRFSIRMETQAEKSDGDLKNVFDITVFDAERDEEKSIRDMSGGEVTTIEDAVVRSFNLFNLGKGNRHYKVVFTDEKDGALSPQRKKEYLEVMRRALEIGKHEQAFFITQTEELQEAAESRIIMEYGGVRIA